MSGRLCCIGAPDAGAPAEYVPAQVPAAPVVPAQAPAAQAPAAQAPAAQVPPSSLPARWLTPASRPRGGLRPCVCAIGVFDGVHLGHQALIKKTVLDARHRGVVAVALTFDPDPQDVLTGPRLRSCLTEINDRMMLLRHSGADDVICLAFTPQVAQLGWQEFAHQVLSCELKVCAVHVGANFRFGLRGQGSPELLARFGAKEGFEVRIHELLCRSGGIVSATRIRGLVQKGDVRAAQELLGRSHVVRGCVVRGRGAGSSFGFPTANIEVNPRICMPAQGVYAGWLASGPNAWPAAINVGRPPTFTTARDPSFCEVNVLGFEGDLYGHEVEIAFLRWLRTSHSFKSTTELKREVLSNIEWVRTHLGDKARAKTDIMWNLNQEQT